MFCSSTNSSLVKEYIFLSKVTKTLVYRFSIFNYDWKSTWQLARIMSTVGEHCVDCENSLGFLWRVGSSVIWRLKSDHSIKTIHAVLFTSTTCMRKWRQLLKKVCFPVICKIITLHLWEIVNFPKAVFHLHQNATNGKWTKHVKMSYRFKQVKFLGGMLCTVPCCLRQLIPRITIL